MPGPGPGRMGSRGFLTEEVMSKFKASTGQRKLFFSMELYIIGASCLLFYVLWNGLVVKKETLGHVGVICALMIALSDIFCLLYYGWKLLDDPLLGEVSFDRCGVIFYTTLHKFTFRFEDCADIGFTHWVKASLYSKGEYDRYVYLSKLPVTKEQQAHLFEGRSTWRRGKRNMPLYRSEYVLFQFEADIFAEFITYVPEPFHTKLIDDLGWDYK